MNDFYVYIYFDIRKTGSFLYGDYLFSNEPIYVGKGKGNRYKQHLKVCFRNKDISYNSYFYRKLRKIIEECHENPPIIIIKDNLTEQDALNLEINLIRLIGREDEKKGPLCNLTDGGDGITNITEAIRERKREMFKKLWKDPIYREKMINISRKLKMTEEHRRKLLEGRMKTYGPCSEEHKTKISNANKGHAVSEETRCKLRKIFKGRLVSEETRQKISKSLRGKKLKEETKIKLSNIFKNRIVSEETRKKMSIAFKGRKHSIESKHKMSIAKKGRKIPDETRKLMSIGQMGKIRSVETREKMHVAAKLRWIKRKSQLEPL